AALREAQAQAPDPEALAKVEAELEAARARIGELEAGALLAQAETEAKVSMAEMEKLQAALKTAEEHNKMLTKECAELNETLINAPDPVQFSAVEKALSEAQADLVFARSQFADATEELAGLRASLAS